MTKIYRSEESLLNDSMEMQILEHLLFARLEGEAIRFEEFMDMCPDSPTQEEAMNILVSLLDEMVLYEVADGFRVNMPVEAMRRAGFYPEGLQHLAPEGTKLFSLTDRGEEILDNNSIEEVVQYLAALPEFAALMEEKDDGKA